MGRAERVSSRRVYETDLPAGLKSFDQNKKIKMNRSRCPHCGVKLGNFLYADACPRCHEELKNNTKPLVQAEKEDSRKQKLWPVRIFFSILRLVES